MTGVPKVAYPLKSLFWQKGRMLSDKGGNRKTQNEDEDPKKMSGTLPREEVNLKVFQTMLTIYQVILHTLRYNFVELLTVTIYTTSRKGAACSGILPCHWSTGVKRARLVVASFRVTGPPASKCRQRHISQEYRRLALIPSLCA
jgi:hypothetical protein